MELNLEERGALAPPTRPIALGMTVATLGIFSIGVAYFSSPVPPEQVNYVKQVILSDEGARSRYGTPMEIEHRRTRFFRDSTGTKNVTLVMEVRGPRSSGLLDAEYRSDSPSLITVRPW